MDFKIPEGYHNFVSSSEEWMNEIQIGSTSDFIEYSIFLDGNIYTSFSSKLIHSLDILNSLRGNDFLFINRYFWNNQPFNLNIIIDKQNEQVYMKGRTNFDQMIEDEWFIVFILFKLSQKFRDINIRVEDNDGEFLLIESSEFIEDWLGPENSGNRVWIRNGDIHIIPLDESGFKNCSLDLNKALKILDKDPSQYIVSHNVLNSIKERITLYPSLIDALEHKVVVILPKKVAYLLSTHTDIIPLVVQNFCDIDKEELSKIVSKSRLDIFNSFKMLGEEEEYYHFLDFSLTKIHLSRSIYAKLTFKKFYPPRKYHGAMREIKELGSRKVSKAFDIGCRLACGLEVFIQRNRHLLQKEDIKIPINDVQKPLLELIEQKGVDPSTTEVLQNYLQENKLYFSEDFQNIIDKQIDIELFYKDKVEIVLSSIENFQAIELKPIVNFQSEIRIFFQPLLDGTLASDEEAWLYFTPEEFDLELKQRLNGFSAPNIDDISFNDHSQMSKLSETVPPFANDENEKTKSEVTDSKNLQDLVDRFKDFLAQESDFDGIKNENIRTKFSRDDSIKDTKPQSVEDDDQKLPVDFDSVMKIVDSVENQESFVRDEDAKYEEELKFLQTYFNKEDLDDYVDKKSFDQSESESEDDSDMNSNQQGVNSKNSNNNHFIFDGESEQDDSDDEVRDQFDSGKGMFQDENIYDDDLEDSLFEEELDNEDEFFNQYQRAMDAEIFKEFPLAETFNSNRDIDGPSIESIEDVDIDLNFIKNLLESHAEGMGLPFGPGSQIFSQLGKNFPRPPI